MGVDIDRVANMPLWRLSYVSVLEYNHVGKSEGFVDDNQVMFKIGQTDSKRRLRLNWVKTIKLMRFL